MLIEEAFDTTYDPSHATADTTVKVAIDLNQVFAPGASMNDYRPKVPRAAFALGAVALTAITLGALVVAPAAYDSGFGPTMTLSVTAPAATQAPVEVAISPARVDVIGAREPDVAWALHDPSKPCKPEV